MEFNQEALVEFSKNDWVKLALLALAVGVTIYVVKENGRLRAQLLHKKPCGCEEEKNKANFNTITPEEAYRRRQTEKYPDGAYKPPFKDIPTEAPPPTDQIPPDIPVEGMSGPITDIPQE